MSDQLEQTAQNEPQTTPEAAPQAVSPARIAANRANARKSTGPRTRKGKDRSRQNALKHGLLANQILINDDDPAEAPELFQALIDGVIAHFNPADPFEELLVQRLAVCYWRLRRAFRYEAGAVRNLRYPQDPLTAHLRNLNGPKKPFTYVLPDAVSMNHLCRYAGMIHRELNHTFRQLQTLRAARDRAEKDSLSETDGLRSEPSSWVNAILRARGLGNEY